MKTLLLEIGSEEIPAGYIVPALNAFSSSLKSKLAEERIAHGEMRVAGTPRRLVLEVADVAEKQSALSTEMMGPPAKVGFDADGKPTVAASRFAEKVGVPVGRLKVKQTAKGEYLCARKRERGRSTRTVLARILPGIVLGLPFPKTMRWADLDIAFARPVHSLLALLGDRIVSFRLGNLKSGRSTRGHFFMRPGRIKVADPSAYRQQLRESGVIVDIAERRAEVEREIAAAAAAAGGKVLPDEELVDIVTNLVELPLPTVGRFEDEFLQLPQEILITAMREHQKYFAIVDDRGRLMPGFIAVNNTRTRDMDLVATGHERVLRARLKDAQFFYLSDRKESFDQRLEKLEGVLFQARLGSMYEKTLRVERLAAHLAALADPAPDFAGRVRRAARICKADLVSQTVGEFPKLQGVMGRIYAAEDGEPADVAAAVEEHYRPTRSGGRLPETSTGAVVAMADKLDSICGCFSLGMVPTGASDPYALRRQAIGIIQIMRAFDFDFSLRDLVAAGVDGLGDKRPADPQKTVDEVYRFFGNRMAHLLAEEGFDREVVAAVTAVTVDRVPDVWKRVAALQELRSEADFEALAAAFKRVGNIIRKSGDQAAGTVRADRFSDPCEGELHRAFEQARLQVADDLQAARYPQALRRIAGLRPAVDAFFDGVLVMDKDPAVRRNRLALLACVAGLFERFADFSGLSG